MSLFDDDIEWVQPGASTVSGTFHGKTEVMEHLGRLAEKGLTVKLNQLIAEGDTVVAITEVTAGGETGEDADVFTVRDGKTVHVRGARRHGAAGAGVRQEAARRWITDLRPIWVGPSPMSVAGRLLASDCIRRLES